jgi:hypothetical protein
MKHSKSVKIAPISEILATLAKVALILIIAAILVQGSFNHWF